MNEIGIRYECGCFFSFGSEMAWRLDSGLKYMCKKHKSKKVLFFESECGCEIYSDVSGLGGALALCNKHAEDWHLWSKSNERRSLILKRP